MYKSSTNFKWKIKRLSDKKSVAYIDDAPTACPELGKWDMYIGKATEVTDCNGNQPTVKPTTTTTTKKPTPKPTTKPKRKQKPRVKRTRCGCRMQVRSCPCSLKWNNDLRLVKKPCLKLILLFFER